MTSTLRIWTLCLLAIFNASAWSATAPKILVLTTHEGYDNESFTVKDPHGGPGINLGNFYEADGQLASDNLATAFGLPVPPSTTSALIKNNPDVKYLYGALSVRPAKPAGVDSAAVSFTSTDTTRYSTTPTQLVRVLSSVGAATDATTGNATSGETVVYVPDSTPYLDVNNLAKIFKPANGDRYDLVVVGTTYKKATESAYQALAKVMQDPALRPNAVLYFVDSCCDSSGQLSGNMTRFVANLLQPATKDTTSPDLLEISSNYYGDTYPPLSSDTAFPVNKSKYAEGFKDLLPGIHGGYFYTFDNVPKDNILFRHPGAQDTAPGNDAYGVFFPAKQIFGGAGTCTFATVDISPFDGTKIASNTSGGTTGGASNIGQAFINAALAGGACGGVASISTDPTPKQVTLGQPATTITLTVTNETITDAGTDQGIITGGRVESPLPANLKFAANNTVTTTCTGATVSNTTNSFSVAGFSIPYKSTCTITLPVEWTDTTDPATNACINATNHTSTLTITPGETQQFSTTQGQTHTQAIAQVVCSAPELQLTTTPTSLSGPYRAGDMVSYDVTVENLSQTAAGTNAQLTGLAPAGVTPTITPKANPAACQAAAACTLAAGEVATFTVQFPAPANAATMSFAPTVALPSGIPANTEVTLVNNTVTLAAALQKQLSVQAQLTTAGGADFSALAGNNMAYAVASCNASPASGAAPLGLNAAGPAQASAADGGAHCDVSFSGAPGPLPAGYQLASATPVLTDTTDPATGAQTVVATWTVLPPGAASVTGIITGAPTTFPTDLVGKTVDFALTCSPNAATPATGTLTVNASGQLSTTTAPMVPAGSTCTLTLTSDPSALPLPQGYVWKTPVISGTGNAFTVTLTMAKQSTNNAAVPVPTLSQWALYALGMLMLLAAAQATRKQRGKR